MSIDILNLFFNGTGRKAIKSFYCINGIVTGYLYRSPFEALTLAMIIQTISRILRNISTGIPIIMKQRGNARIMYSKIEI